MITTVNKKRKIESTNLMQKEFKNNEKKKIRPTFEINNINEYQNNCEEVYRTILYIFNNDKNYSSLIYAKEYFAKLITEYAATKYINCNLCYKKFNCIDNIEDFTYNDDGYPYKYIDGKNKIKFYFYPEIQLSQKQIIKASKILCIQCFIQNICSCNIQSWPEKNVIFKCYQCGCSICDNCLQLKNNHHICTKCNRKSKINHQKDIHYLFHYLNQ